MRIGGRHEIAFRELLDLRQARDESLQRRGLRRVARLGRVHHRLRRAHHRKRRERGVCENRPALDGAAERQPDDGQAAEAVHEVEHAPLDREEGVQHRADRRERKPAGDEQTYRRFSFRPERGVVLISKKPAQGDDEEERVEQGNRPAIDANDRFGGVSRTSENSGVGRI